MYVKYIFRRKIKKNKRKKKYERNDEKYQRMRRENIIIIAYILIYLYCI